MHMQATNITTLVSLGKVSSPITWALSPRHLICKDSSAFVLRARLAEQLAQSSKVDLNDRLAYILLSTMLAHMIVPPHATR